MTETTTEKPSSTWLTQTLNRALPTHIQRIREHQPLSLDWLRDELVGTVLQFVGDFAADARDKAARYEKWLDGLTNHVEEHEDALDAYEERIASLEAFVDALAQETQLLPSDADDIAKLAAGSKWISTELLQAGEQNEEGRSRLAELVALADRVGKLAESARLDLTDEEGETEEAEAEAEAEPDAEPN